MIENPLSTAACPWDQVSTILRTIQHFLYLVFPCIRSTEKESKCGFFSSKGKKASLCLFWAVETSWKYSTCASSTCFDKIPFKLYSLSTSLSKELTHFCLSGTMLPNESDDAQHATWYLSGQHSWNFWTNKTIICLAFFKKDHFFTFDGSADRNEDFVAAGSLINSQGRFSEFERSNLNNFTPELTCSKASGLTFIFIKCGEHLQEHASTRKGTIGLLIWNNCKEHLSWEVTSW